MWVVCEAQLVLVSFRFGYLPQRSFTVFLFHLMHYILAFSHSENKLTIATLFRHTSFCFIVNGTVMLLFLSFLN